MRVPAREALLQLRPNPPTRAIPSFPIIRGEKFLPLSCFPHAAHSFLKIRVIFRESIEKEWGYSYDEYYENRGALMMKLLCWYGLLA